jgi:ABC-type xylose transport system substrate-binding protein
MEFFTGDPGDNNINFFFGGAMDVLKPYLDKGVIVCPSGQTAKAPDQHRRSEADPCRKNAFRSGSAS